MTEIRAPRIAFAARDDTAPEPRLTIHVNFGVLTGREVTAAEIDRLAEWLLDLVEQVTIVSETRHEIDRHSEAAVHQVRIEVPPDRDAASVDELESSLLERAELWARMCVADRPEGSPPAGAL